jgi:hypothetical protein
VLQWLLLALILTIHSFCGAVSLGAAEQDRRARLRVVALFAAADCGLPLVGILVGAALARLVGTMASYVGAGVIILTAICIFFEHGREAAPVEPAPMGTLLLPALGLGGSQRAARCSSVGCTRDDMAGGLVGGIPA